VPIIAASALAGGTPLLLFARSSGRRQVGSGALARQVADGRAKTSELGLTLCEVIACRESGKMKSPRKGFRRAVERAKHHGAVIGAANLSRLIRAEAYHSETNREAMPTAEEIDALLALAEGVGLATFDPPDLTAAEVLSRAVKRGQRVGGNKAGRPSSIPEKLKWQVLEAREGGDSLRVIAARFGLSKDAVRDWLKIQAEGGW
jgi:hypothetical protein